MSERIIEVSKTLKGWRTILLNVTTGVVALVAWPEVVALVDPQWLLLVSAAANIIMRTLTNTKAGQVDQT